jgi:hypothetical protein
MLSFDCVKEQNCVICARCPELYVGILSNQGPWGQEDAVVAARNLEGIANEWNVFQIHSERPTTADRTRKITAGTKYTLVSPLS